MPTARPAQQMPKEPVKEAVFTPYELLQQEFWSLLVKFPELYSAYATSLDKKYFVDSPFERLYESALNIYNKAHELDVASLRASFQEGNTENSIDVLILRPYRNVEELTVLVAKAELAELWKRIQEQWAKEYRKRLERAMAVAEKQGDKERIMQLLAELQKNSL